MEKIADAAATVGDLLRRVPEDSLAREVEERIGGGWHCWYGHATRVYRAMPRSPYPWWGWVAAESPGELALKVAEVDAFYGPGRRP